MDIQCSKVAQNLSAFEYAKTVSVELERICAPIFNYFDFSGVGYVKKIPGGKMLYLASNKDWIQQVFENEFFNENDYFHHVRNYVKKNGTKKLILSGTPKGKQCSALYDFNIWNIYAHYRKKQNYVEGWLFGSTRDNKSVLDLYEKHPHVLDLLILYLSEKTFDLTVGASKDKFIITKNDFSNTLDSDYDNLEEMLANICPKRFPIKFKNKKIIFSKREIECLSYLANGYAYKEVAKSMKISVRTIEDNVNKMKAKAKLYNKHDLIKMYHDNFETQEIKMLSDILKRSQLNDCVE